MNADSGTDDEPDGVDRLVAGIMRRAVADARQTSDPALAQEAWQFLDVCAPTVAEKLRRRLQGPSQKPDSTAHRLSRKGECDRTPTIKTW